MWRKWLLTLDLKNMGAVEAFFVNFKKEFKGVKGLFKLAKKIQDLKVDAIADLHNVLRSKILRFLLFFATFKPGLSWGAASSWSDL